jgi:hypothetical protein
MTTCKHCAENASILLNSLKIPLCVSHFSLRDHETNDVTILDECLFAEQVESLQGICRDAISDISVKMYELQRIEENNNRLKQTAATSRTSETVTFKRPAAKASLWRTDLANIDKAQLLKDIEKTELDMKLKRDSSNCGAACSSCGSRNTTTRDRHVVESGKSDIWGNKDGDVANSIECMECGYIQ